VLAGVLNIPQERTNRKAGSVGGKRMTIPWEKQDHAVEFSLTECPYLKLEVWRSLSKLPMATTKIIPHLMTLADLSPSQIKQIIIYSYNLKQQSLPWLDPLGSKREANTAPRLPPQFLFNKTIALLFSKRSTRTRLAAETSSALLGGRALFLSRDDIQLGVNESFRDTARVVGGMCQGIFARVGEHAEIEVGTSCYLYFIPILILNSRNWQSIHLYLFSMRFQIVGIPHKFLQTCSHFMSSSNPQRSQLLSPQ